MARLATIVRDERGNSIIELALVVPFLSSLLIGMVDISRGYSAKLQLQQAAQQAIEKVMQTSASSSVIATLTGEAATAAGVATSAVAVDFWLECNGTRQSVYDSSCSAGQTYARYLTVDITKAYAPMFRVKFLGSNNDGTFTLHGKAGIRTQ